MLYEVLAFKYLHNSVTWYFLMTNAWCYRIVQVKYPFKLQGSPMDFNDFLSFTPWTRNFKLALDSPSPTSSFYYSVFSVNSSSQATLSIPLTFVSTILLMPSVKALVILLFYNKYQISITVSEAFLDPATAHLSPCFLLFSSGLIWLFLFIKNMLSHASLPLHCKVFSAWNVPLLLPT